MVLIGEVLEVSILIGKELDGRGPRYRPGARPNLAVRKLTRAFANLHRAVSPFSTKMASSLLWCACSGATRFAGSDREPVAA